MECKKCGANIADTAKFCGYCGNPVEQIPVSNEPVQNVEQTVEPSANMIQNSNVDLGKTIVIENLADNKQETFYKVSDSPKKSGKNFVPLLAILLVIVAAILLIFAFGKSSNNSVSVLEKAMLNLSEKSKNNGTVTAKINLEEESTGSIVVSATSKYAKENDKYNLQVTLNKNMFMDETSVYMSLDESEANLYLQSSLVDMIGMTSSDINKWLSYSMDLSEEDVDLDEIEELDDVYLRDVLDKEHFVYVDTSDDVRHYKLVINKKLIENIKTKLSKSEKENVREIADSINMDEVDLSEPINVDLYINKSNELVKISFDLTELLAEEGITKANLDIEFSDLGTTNVTIPSEALNSSEDLMNYFTTNAVDTDYNYDTDSDYNDSY